MSVLCQSSVQQLSTNRFDTNFSQSPKHLPSVSLPHFLHTSNNNFEEENQACSHCQRKNIYQHLLIYQIYYYEVTVGLLAFFLPWHLSSSDIQCRGRGLPMVLMLVRRKALNLLIIHHQGIDPLGRLHTGQAQSLHSEDNPYLACISIETKRN